MSEPTLRSTHLFTLTLDVDSNVADVGETPYGRRRVATVKGGHFEGEELKGTVLPTPAGDWLLLRRDGILQLDVRITLKTHDDHLIYMSYRVMRHGPAVDHDVVVDVRIAGGEANRGDRRAQQHVDVFEQSTERPPQ